MTNFQGRFLVAMPGVHEPHFAHSVIYICEHNDEGTMGIMLNRVMAITVLEMVANLQGCFADKRYLTPDSLVLDGGPVTRERGFIIHTKTKDGFVNSRVIDEDIMLTTSSDVLSSIGTAKSPEHYLVALGCCKWQHGQLISEINDNCWSVMDYTKEELFSTPAGERWDNASLVLGLDPEFMTTQVGHA